jgi:hypothetical protein
MILVSNKSDFCKRKCYPMTMASISADKNFLAQSLLLNIRLATQGGAFAEASATRAGKAYKGSAGDFVFDQF